jgi:hypothetical protein
MAVEIHEVERARIARRVPAHLRAKRREVSDLN